MPLITIFVDSTLCSEKDKEPVSQLFSQHLSKNIMGDFLTAKQIKDFQNQDKCLKFSILIII